MRLKSILLFSSVLLSTMIFFSGCIKEDSISEPYDPISIFRYANFSENVDQMRVQLIKNNKVAYSIDLNKYTIAEYKTLPAGKYHVVITNPATNDTIKFLQNSEFSANDLNSYFLYGYYSSNENINSADVFIMYHGKNYTSIAPPTGTFSFHVLNLAKKYVVGAVTDTLVGQIDLVDVSADPDSFMAINIDVSEKPDEVYGRTGLKPGTREIWTKYKELNWLVLAKESAMNFEAGKNYIYVLTGHTGAFKSTVISSTPPAVRER